MSVKSRVAYFRKLMKVVPKDEPNYEKIIQAYKDYIEKIKQEDED